LDFREYLFAPFGSSIGYEADARDPGGAFLRLHYTFTESGERHDTRMPLVRTSPHYGGVRFWVLCPVTRRRVAKLYLPPGGDIFASRQAYGLSYGSQSEGPVDRAVRRKWKLANKIGGEDWPERPKGMHWATLDRLCEAAWAQEERSDALFFRRMAPYLAKYA
jgi:hypothetical protein